jgi:hypothetical protein
MLIVEVEQKTPLDGLHNRSRPWLTLSVGDMGISRGWSRETRKLIERCGGEIVPYLFTHSTQQAAENALLPAANRSFKQARVVPQWPFDRFVDGKE